jgi:DNA-directed RNA polymerase subunit beta'
VAQGLPRVEELLEARQPKGQAIITTVSGLVDTWAEGNNIVVQVTPDAETAEKIDLQGREVKVKHNAKVKKGQILAEGAELPPLVAAYDGTVTHKPKDNPTAIMMTAKVKAPVKVELSKFAEIVVKAGDRVEAGDRLTAGSLHLQDLMEYKGVTATERYILNEILRIYAGQGAEIDAKHLEIIIRQMFSRVQIDNPGDSLYSTGEIISRAMAEEENNALLATGKQPLTFNQLLLGITKVSIYSDSFLSAASFQDTTRVLINAAIRGKEDKLIGLKENVIIGRRIPVGTGARGEEFIEEFVEETSEKPKVAIVDNSPEGAVDKDDLMMDADVV